MTNPSSSWYPEGPQVATACKGVTAGTIRRREGRSDACSGRCDLPFKSFLQARRNRKTADCHAPAFLVPIFVRVPAAGANVNHPSTAGRQVSDLEREAEQKTPVPLSLCFAPTQVPWSTSECARSGDRRDQSTPRRLASWMRHVVHFGMLHTYPRPLVDLRVCARSGDWRDQSTPRHREGKK